MAAELAHLLWDKPAPSDRGMRSFVVGVMRGHLPYPGGLADQPETVEAWITTIWAEQERAKGFERRLRLRG